MTKAFDPTANELASHAWSGHYEPLAKHLEAGGELDLETREFLVAFLRQEVRFKRGNRRAYGSQKRDAAARSYVIRMHMAHGGTRADVLRMWLKNNPSVSEETLKNMLKRAAADRVGRRKSGYRRIG